jgi:hypothetical protein
MQTALQRSFRCALLSQVPLPSKQCRRAILRRLVVLGGFDLALLRHELHLTSDEGLEAYVDTALLHAAPPSPQAVLPFEALMYVVIGLERILHLKVCTCTCAAYVHHFISSILSPILWKHSITGCFAALCELALLPGGHTVQAAPEVPQHAGEKQDSADSHGCTPAPIGEDCPADHGVFWVRSEASCATCPAFAGEHWQSDRGIATQRADESAYHHSPNHFSSQTQAHSCSV